MSLQLCLWLGEFSWGFWSLNIASHSPLLSLLLPEFPTQWKQTKKLHFMLEMGACPGNHKTVRNSVVSLVYYFLLSILRYVLLLEILWNLLANFCLENFCQCKFLSTKHPFLIYLACAPLLGVCCISMWLICFFPLGYWALWTISGVLLLLQGWNILLYQSASQSDNTITCLVPALLNLTDETVIGCSPFSSHHISPGRNRVLTPEHFICSSI